MFHDVPRRSTLGFLMIARAMVRRCFCPPLRFVEERGPLEYKTFFIKFNIITSKILLQYNDITSSTRNTRNTRITLP
jgi:hypothetical protein